MRTWPDLTRLPAAAFRRTPWKNGGGTTTDIAYSYRPGAEAGGWEGMTWRLGRTRIDTPAPFSFLPGQDRILAVIGGRGLVLRVEDGRALDAREPYRPVAFPGEWAIRSELEEGGVEVLNLMGSRERARLRLSFAEAGPGSLPPGDIVLYAVHEDSAPRIDGTRVTISGGDAVAFHADARLPFDGGGGLVAVACVQAS